MVRQTGPELDWLPDDRNGLGAELYAFSLQLATKLAEVLDDAVPDDCCHAGVRTHHAAFASSETSSHQKCYDARRAERLGRAARRDVVNLAGTSAHEPFQIAPDRHRRLR